MKEGRKEEVSKSEEVEVFQTEGKTSFSLSPSISSTPSNNSGKNPCGVENGDGGGGLEGGGG